jgi:hypothetical protein
MATVIDNEAATCHEIQIQLWNFRYVQLNQYKNECATEKWK